MHEPPGFWSPDDILDKTNSPKTRVTEKYRKRLQNYIHWCLGEFLRPALQERVSRALLAEEVMWLWETHWLRGLETSEPELLQLFVQGKQCRDWHVTEWRRGVKDRLFVPEEFFGTLGLRSAEEFAGIFGRPVDTHLLRRALTQVDSQIDMYEKLLKG